LLLAALVAAVLEPESEPQLVLDVPVVEEIPASLVLLVLPLSPAVVAVVEVPQSLLLDLVAEDVLSVPAVEEVPQSLLPVLLAEDVLSVLVTVEEVPQSLLPDLLVVTLSVPVAVEVPLSLPELPSWPP
jgi:hypothetical protein